MTERQNSIKEKKRHKIKTNTKIKAKNTPQELDFYSK